MCGLSSWYERLIIIPWNYDLELQMGLELLPIGQTPQEPFGCRINIFGFSGENKVYTGRNYMEKRNRNINDCEQFDLAGAIRDCFKSDYMELLYGF